MTDWVWISLGWGVLILFGYFLLLQERKRDYEFRKWRAEQGYRRCPACNGGGSINLRELSAPAAAAVAELTSRRRFLTEQEAAEREREHERLER